MTESSRVQLVWSPPPLHVRNPNQIRLPQHHSIPHLSSTTTFANRPLSSVSASSPSSHVLPALIHATSNILNLLILPTLSTVASTNPTLNPSTFRTVNHSMSNGRCATSSIARRRFSPLYPREKSSRMLFWVLERERARRAVRVRARVPFLLPPLRAETGMRKGLVDRPLPSLPPLLLSPLPLV